MTDWSVDVADAQAWVKALPAKSAHLAIFDPPYPGMERHVTKGTTTRLIGKGWFSPVSYDYLLDLFDLLWYAMEWNSHVYMFADQDLAFHLVPTLAEKTYGERKKEGGWTFWKALIWHKAPGKLGGGYHYRAQHEMVLFFEKGKRKLSNLSAPDVLVYPRVKSPAIATQKPVELLSVLIGASSVPGELVIDPFCGSGSTGVAAVSCGRRFQGCDLDERIAVVARDRIREVEVPAPPCEIECTSGNAVETANDNR